MALDHEAIYKAYSGTVVSIDDSAGAFDKDGNPYIVRYNKSDDIHYLASEKDGKKTKWTATYKEGSWQEALKD